MLNNHQYRFGFQSSQECVCGFYSENVFHFLFNCPNYNKQRVALKAACLAEKETWPPSLSVIAQSTALWAAFCSFIHKTRRLGFKRLNPTTQN
jgi:hypothetical protein